MSATSAAELSSTLYSSCMGDEMWASLGAATQQMAWTRRRSLPHHYDGFISSHVSPSWAQASGPPVKACACHGLHIAHAGSAWVRLALSAAPYALSSLIPSCYCWNHAKVAFSSCSSAVICMPWERRETGSKLLQPRSHSLQDLLQIEADHRKFERPVVCASSTQPLVDLRACGVASNERRPVGSTHAQHPLICASPIGWTSSHQILQLHFNM